MNGELKVSIKQVRFGDPFTLADGNGRQLTFQLAHYPKEKYPSVILTNLSQSQIAEYYAKTPHKYKRCLKHPTTGIIHLHLDYAIYCYLTDTEPVCCYCVKRDPLNGLKT